MRRPIRGLSTRRPVPPKLREANRLYEAAEYEKAAELYSEMAQRAEQNGLPQTANLYLRAGIACLKNADVDQAGKLLKQSIQYCVDHKRWPQLQRVMRAASAELDAAGQDALKDDLFSWAEAQLSAAHHVSPNASKEDDDSNSRTVQLPVHCPNCGGPVQPIEVEWYDSENPICAFCGSILRDE
jgi:tetratricopeptide (TPR) repeat protein